MHGTLSNEARGESMKKLLMLVLVGGLLILAFVKFRSSFLQTPRLVSNFSEIFQFEGMVTFADPQTGLLPVMNSPAVYQRVFHVLPQASGQALEDLVLLGGKKITRVIWKPGSIDFKNGQHLQSGFDKDYYRFPRHTEKKTYVLRYSYLKGIPLQFMREEDLGGMKTYLFSYQGKAEWTELYQGTEDFPGVPVAPGQEIRCSDDAFYYRAWVEPRTGDMVKIEEGCPSGDALYDKSTGKLLAFIVRWCRKTTDADVHARLEKIKQQIH